MWGETRGGRGGGTIVLSRDPIASGSCRAGGNDTDRTTAGPKESRNVSEPGRLSKDRGIVTGEEGRRDGRLKETTGQRVEKEHFGEEGYSSKTGVTGLTYTIKIFYYLNESIVSVWYFKWVNFVSVSTRW